MATGVKFGSVRLGKQRGSGVSPAVFPPTFGRPKVGPPEAIRGPGAGPPPISSEVRGRVALGGKQQGTGAKPPKRTKEPPGRLAWRLLPCLLFQFTGGVGGEVGVDEAVDVSVYDGVAIAVCPSG